MGFGLFGKLPQKRDFVALGIPHSILHPFETWLQSAVAASRNELGRDWEERYLVAPIWRFWLGHEIFGQACAGAVMPSVDKVGRFFPLAILNFGAAGVESAPPTFQSNAAWYAAIEERLLSVLGEGAEVEAETLTAGLAEPQPIQPPGPEAMTFKGGASWTGAAGTGADELLASLVQPDYWRAAAGRSFWWTGGGEGGLPMVHVRPGLPDPYFFTRMLVGIG